jgi:hypothetical protein
MVATCLAGAIPHFFAEPQVELPGTIGRVNIIIPPLIIIGATAVGPLGRLINAQLTYKRRRVALTAVLLFIAATLTYRVFR